MSFVYGLFDPRSDKLFYHGTTDVPKRRLSEHCRLRCQTSAGWIEEIQQAGSQPEMRIFAELPRAQALDFEKELNRFYTAQGAPLANNQLGRKLRSQCKNHGSPWTPDASLQLLRLVQKGADIRDIALEMKRSRRAITLRKARLDTSDLGRPLREVFSERAPHPLLRLRIFFMRVISSS